MSPARTRIAIPFTATSGIYFFNWLDPQPIPERAYGPSRAASSVWSWRSPTWTGSATGRWSIAISRDGSNIVQRMDTYIHTLRSAAAHYAAA